MGERAVVLGQILYLIFIKSLFVVFILFIVFYDSNAILSSMAGSKTVKCNAYSPETNF